MTFTVVVGLVASGNSSTRKPFASVYSVMPSTVAPCVTPGGSAAPATEVHEGQESEEGRGEEPGSAGADGRRHGDLDDENRGVRVSIAART